MANQYNNLYFDIESLPDIFSLCAYHEITDTIDFYYLIDQRHSPFSMIEESLITQAIRKANHGFNGPVYYYDLNNVNDNRHLARAFGCDAGGSVKNPDWHFPLKPDTAPDYDPAVDPYIMGYNSNNYDLTMLALYFSELICDNNGVFLPTTAELMRQYNDELFTSFFKPNMPDRLKYRIVPSCQVEGAPNAQWPVKYRRGYGKNPREGTAILIGDKYMVNEGWNPTSPAYYIRNAMINSGRHIDVARLNEKQSRVGLKRLLGMLGYQILEPEEDLSGKKSNGPRTFESLCNLFAYNASDTLNLKNLFHHKTYLAAFELKKQMLADYPELIYDQKTVQQPGTVKVMDKKTGQIVDQPVMETKRLYEPGIAPDNVRRRRHTINSSSAQLAASCLSPYGNLTDEPCVSFLYPSAKKAKELGIQRRNILRETEEFVMTRLVPIAKGEEGKIIIDGLMQMLEMYKSIEGQDFNASHDGEDIKDLRSVAGRVNVPYMAPDGTFSDCYVTFSVGGLHGAQFNKALYDKDMAVFNQEMALFRAVYDQFGGDAKAFLTDINAKGKPCRRKTIIVDGVEYPASEFITSSSTLKAASWKKKYLEAKPPELFPVDKKGVAKLRKRYAMTSFGPVNHEDFTSYYPILLVNMSAYENPGLGYDRYYEIFTNKEKFGKLMKDKSIDAEQRGIYSNMRNGTKLILNSASGASDTAYNTPIRMNNRITAMRIIGQMFTWRIGQAQSLEGAKVVSTNTDGLYTEFEPTLNAQILAREAAAIQIGIEPEPCFLVSKDANNRFEADIVGRTGNAQADLKVTAASGGSLACKDGPSPDKALAHPAVLDWALCEFLKYKALRGAMDDYEPEAGRYLLTTYADQDFKDRRKTLQMFQNIVSASLSTGQYPFATKKPITAENEATITPIALQHYSRVFYVDPEKVPDAYKKDIVYLCMAYVRPQGGDASPLATNVIANLMGDKDALMRGTPSLKKVNGIELSTPCIICNEELETTRGIEPEWLDRDYYNRLLGDSYTKNWRNDLAGTSEESEDDEDTQDED